MAKQSIPRSVTDQWIKGHEYEFSYDVSHFKILGVEIPIESWKRSAFERQAAQLQTQVRSDSRWTLLESRANYDAMNVTFRVRALVNPFPIAIIVGAIAAIAILYGLTMVVSRVTEFVESGNAGIEIDSNNDGKPDTKLTLPLIPIIGLGVVFMLARK